MNQLEEPELREVDRLSAEERSFLLQLARQALEAGVCGQKLVPLDLHSLPARLKEKGASFVTLTRLSLLRGCIGSLEPVLPLAEDVREHAVAAALQDYRFPPVTPTELPEIAIEISRLTPPMPLIYDQPEDLIHCLRPGIDGVVLMDGIQRSTFLPQVWKKITSPEEFLAHLCFKMGADPQLWRRKKLQVFIYQVEEFNESLIGH